MGFSIGDNVQFRHTGETGKVIALLDDDMVLVRIDDRFRTEIPASVEDLQTPARPAPFNPSATIATQSFRRRIPGKPDPEAGLQVFLAFEPMPGKDGHVSRFKCWIINNNTQEYLIDIALYIGEDCLWHFEEKLDASLAIELDDLLLDDLNDSPEMEVESRMLSTAGLAAPVLDLIKLRPKPFLNRFRQAPVLQAMAYVFPVKTTAEADGKEDLKAYTKKNAAGPPRGPSQPASNAVPYKPYDLMEYSTFIPEIDLHAEALNPAYLRLDKGEILRLQMRHCAGFLDKAIRLGVHKVYLIHGVGEGKLKEAIAQYLRERPEVVRFNNQYHHKYGYGATEVTLR